MRPLFEIFHECLSRLSSHVRTFEFSAYFRAFWLKCYFVFLIVDAEMEERISPPVWLQPWHNDGSATGSASTAAGRAAPGRARVVHASGTARAGIAWQCVSSIFFKRLTCKLSRVNLHICDSSDLLLRCSGRPAELARELASRLARYCSPSHPLGSWEPGVI